MQRGDIAPDGPAVDLEPVGDLGPGRRASASGAARAARAAGGRGRITAPKSITDSGRKLPYFPISLGRWHDRERRRVMGNAVLEAAAAHGLRLLHGSVERCTTGACAQRLAGSDEWDEFEATSRRAPDPRTGWATRTSSGRTTAAASSACRSASSTRRRSCGRSTGPTRAARGALDPPVFGSFAGDSGVFLGEDTFEGRPILVRFIWSGVTRGRRAGSRRSRRTTATRGRPTG